MGATPSGMRKISDIETQPNPIGFEFTAPKLGLCPKPSHLEANGHSKAIEAAWI